MPLFNAMDGPTGGNTRVARWNALGNRNGDPLAALTAWMAGATYADFNAKMLDRQFQESTGQTAVTASADKVGLWLDGAQWGGKTLPNLVAGQPELAAPLDFTNAAWTSVGTVSGVTANSFTTGSTAGEGKVRSLLTIGKTYELIASFTKGVSGSELRVTNSGSSTNTIGTYGGTSGTINLRFLAADSRLYFRLATAPDTLTITSIQLREVPGYHGLNGTAAQRLNLLISGTRYTLTADGSDDNLLTTWLAASGGNTIFFDVDVPATGGQFFIGAHDGSTGRFFVGFDASGRLCAGVGGSASTVIFATGDLRGTRCVGALTQEAGVVKLFTLAGGEVFSGAYTSAPTISVPVRLAALNTSGAANSWFSGGIARIIPVQKGGLTLSDWQTIGPQLAAAGA